MYPFDPTQQVGVPLSYRNEKPQACAIYSGEGQKLFQLGWKPIDFFWTSSQAAEAEIAAGKLSIVKAKVNNLSGFDFGLANPNDDQSYFVGFVGGTAKAIYSYTGFLLSRFSRGVIKKLGKDTLLTTPLPSMASFASPITYVQYLHGVAKQLPYYGIQTDLQPLFGKPLVKSGMELALAMNNRSMFLGLQLGCHGGEFTADILHLGEQHLLANVYSPAGERNLSQLLEGGIDLALADFELPVSSFGKYLVEGPKLELDI